MPVISLDGKRMAFQANPSPLRSWQILTINSNGTGIRQLTNTPASNLAPSISGDGSLIVFFSDLTGNFEIYRVNYNGTGFPHS
jgi:Tol biopolymer transport system component